MILHKNKSCCDFLIIAKHLPQVPKLRLLAPFQEKYHKNNSSNKQNT